MGPYYKGGVALGELTKPTPSEGSRHPVYFVPVGHGSYWRQFPTAPIWALNDVVVRVRG